MTSWIEAAVAIAGIVLVGTVATVIVWRLTGLWRARMAGSREDAYRELAERTAEGQARTAAALEETLAELRRLHARTEELERVLKEVG